MGNGKIHSELLKLGYSFDPSTVRNVMRRHHLPPIPGRGRCSWRTSLNHYRTQMLACDFFIVETVTLQTLYVMFFIELRTRRVHLACCTAHPDSAWVTARQLVWELTDTEQSMRFLIHDRDSKFTANFDQVFASAGIEIVLTPYRTPQANAFAERWVRSVREECLDHLLILGQRHLRCVLLEYMQYYNTARPHQGIHQHAPIPFPSVQSGPVARRDVLGGIIHTYYRQAA
jgi:putative transposase